MSKMEVLSIQNQFQCSPYAVEDWSPKATATTTTSSSSSPSPSIPQVVAATASSSSTPPLAAATTPLTATTTTTQKPYDRQLHNGSSGGNGVAAKLQAKQKSPSSSYGAGERRRYNNFMLPPATQKWGRDAADKPYGSLVSNIQHPAPHHNNNNNNHSSIYTTGRPMSVAVGMSDEDVADGASGPPPHVPTSMFEEAAAEAASATACCQLNNSSAAVQEISRRLQAELRLAKNSHLTCAEVSLPWELTPRIADEIIKISEREPCGVRGSTVYIEFEHEPNNVRRIASFKVDPNTLSTFELYVTLKQDKSGWISRLPQFLKNLTRSRTLLISPEFSLSKKKLYSCE